MLSLILFTEENFKCLIQYVILQVLFLKRPRGGGKQTTLLAHFNPHQSTNLRLTEKLNLVTTCGSVRVFSHKPFFIVLHCTALQSNKVSSPGKSSQNVTISLTARPDFHVCCLLFVSQFTFSRLHYRQHHLCVLKEKKLIPSNSIQEILDISLESVLICEPMWRYFTSGKTPAS